MNETEKLGDIVGGTNVDYLPESLKNYSQDLNIVSPVSPKCIVKPGNTDEVQSIVKWANETSTPLVPSSSGAPHFRGGTVPYVDGSVIVDLGRMKKIIRIDPLNRVAMIEPGVTFPELQAELGKVGMSAYTPLCPRRTESVIGSMLEREPITMPNQHWDSSDPMLCAEVVFGNGEKFRTGEAAGPDTKEEQWEIGNAQMVPFGLSQFNTNRLISGAQGTIAIITWATLKCRYASKLNKTFMIANEKIEPLIDLSYQLLRIRLGGNCFILNGLNLACLLSETPRQIQEMRSNLPPWVLIVSFEGYGPLPEEKVQYEVADFYDMAKSCDLNPVEKLPGVDAENLSRVLSQPSEEPYWKLRFKGACEDIFFQTTLDKTPVFVAEINRLAGSQKHPLEDIGVYIQPSVQGTSCHCEFNLYYSTARQKEVDSTRWLVREGSRDLAKTGGHFSRPYGSWANFAYGFNSQTVILQKKIKDIFDPKGILNPGKLCF